VVVAVYAREAGRTRVLLRDGLRLPLHVGRPPGAPAVPDPRRYLFFREVVAGIVEQADRGDEGLRRRAALEVWEEAGVRVDPADVRLLGAVFPSPGAMSEKFFLAAVEAPPGADALPIPSGDGTPMEEGATLTWMDLDEAIAACVRGELEDAKTELVLRRLRDTL
jgi:ADP-ribose pyrophosphatase